MSKDSEENINPITYIVFAIALLILGLFFIVSQSGVQTTYYTHSDPGYVNQLQPKPVAYWKLDETSGNTAKDSIDSADGIISSGVILNSPGKFNSGYRFPITPSTSNVQINHVNSLNLTQMTLSAWFILDSYVDTAPRILEKSDTFTGYNMLVTNITTTHNIRCQIGQNPTNIMVDSISQISLHVLYHSVCTYDGITLKIYVNGIFDHQTIATPNTIKNNILQLLIGNRRGTFDRPWNGTLDDIRVYNQALSAGDIINIYNEKDSFYQSKITPEFTQYGLGLVPLIVGVGLTIYVFNMRDE